MRKWIVCLRVHSKHLLIVYLHTLHVHVDSTKGIRGIVSNCSEITENRITLGCHFTSPFAIILAMTAHSHDLQVFNWFCSSFDQQRFSNALWIHQKKRFIVNLLRINCWAYTLWSHGSLWCYTMQFMYHDNVIIMEFSGISIIGIWLESH